MEIGADLTIARPSPRLVVLTRSVSRKYFSGKWIGCATAARDCLRSGREASEPDDAFEGTTPGQWWQGRSRPLHVNPFHVDAKKLICENPASFACSHQLMMTTIR
jgi:hypothetical protein